MYRNKWFKRIVCMLMILVILIADIPLTTFQNEVTQAANVTGGNSGAGKGSWGSSYKRTGWLIYIVDKKTGKVPEVKMTINGKKKTVHAVNYVGYSLDSDNKDPSKLKYVYSRVGKHRPAKTFKFKGSNGAEWGAPFDNGQHGRGTKIRDFFKKYDTTKKEWVPKKGGITSKTDKYKGRTTVNSKGETVKEPKWNNDNAAVEKYLGRTAYEKYLTNNYYLCLEAVAIHKNYGKTKWRAFSAYGAAKMIKDTCNGGQYNFIKFSANNCLQIGTCLEKNWPNLPAAVPSSWLNKNIQRKDMEKKVKAKTTSTTKTMGYGFGMAAFRSSEPSEQRTYDEKSSLPSAAPKETVGDMTIVKVYVEEYETNIPQLDLSNMSFSETQNTTESGEEDTAEVSPSEQENTEPDRDGMTAEQTEALDEQFEEAQGNTGETVYDPDDEAGYNEVLVDEEKEGMEDDVSEEDSKFSGEINENEAGNAQDYDYDDYNESGEEDDELMDVNESENEDLFDLLENIDFEYGTVRAYKQVEQVSAGKGGCASSAINPGVGVTKKVGNEIWIMNEDGESKHVDGPGTGYQVVKWKITDKYGKRSSESVENPVAQAVMAYLNSANELVNMQLGQSNTGSSLQSEPLYGGNSSLEMIQGALEGTDHGEGLNEALEILQSVADTPKTLLNYDNWHPKGTSQKNINPKKPGKKYATSSGEDKEKKQALKDSGEFNSMDTIEKALAVAKHPVTPEKGKIKVRLYNGNKVLYVLLMKSTEIDTPKEANYTITESSITRRIWLSKPDKTDDGKEIWATKNNDGTVTVMKNLSEHIFSWYAQKYPYCYHSHCHPCGLYCGCYYCGGSCSWSLGSDVNQKLSIWNTKKDDFPDILATKEGWNKEVKFSSNTDEIVKKFFEPKRTSTGTQRYDEKNWDYACVLMRGKDKLTLSKWINNGEGVTQKTDALNENVTGLKNASSSGFNIDNKPKVAVNDTRKVKDYFEYLSTHFFDDKKTPGLDKTTVLYGTAGCRGKCGNVSRTTYFISDPADPSPEISGPDTSFDVKAKIQVEVYSGKKKITADASYNKKSPLQLSSDFFADMSKFPALPGKLSSSGRMIQCKDDAGNTLKFNLYPYIRMKYDTLASTDKTAYVMGQYIRTLIPNDYAETTFKLTDDPNADLTSAQWSTHAQALKDAKEWEDTHSKVTWSEQVLPGGAQLSVGIKKSNRQKMQVTTYQSILDGFGLKQVEKTGFTVPNQLKMNEAKKAHKDYVNSVIESIKAMSIAQSVETDMEKDTALEGLEVTAGSDISTLENSKQTNTTASKNKKYYFRKPKEVAEAAAAGDPIDPASCGGFDVKPESAPDSADELETYTFFTMTDGTIWMSKNNTSPKETSLGSCIKVCDQNSKAILDDVAKALNDRTYVVDKLRKSLEYKTGKDKTANTEKYGNWAKDGKWYNEAFDGITIVVQKTMLEIGFLDPNIRNTVLDPKVIPLNNGKQDFFKKYFLSQYGTSEDVEKRPKFKGVEVPIAGINKLFYTKTFHIPNVTTQDLR